MYGTPDHHYTVRQKCCDYMVRAACPTCRKHVRPPTSGVLCLPSRLAQEKEASWFAAFVAGDRAEFLEYVADKRKDGEWGDDPEIQVRVDATAVQASSPSYARWTLLAGHVRAVRQACGHLRVRPFVGSQASSHLPRGRDNFVAANEVRMCACARLWLWWGNAP